jgi:hypothetical protein
MDVYREGGEHMTTEDSTTQGIRTHHTLLHYTTSHHTTPTSAEIFPPTLPEPFYKRRYHRPSTEPQLVKAMILVPRDGALCEVGVVTVVVKGK